MDKVLFKATFEEICARPGIVRPSITDGLEDNEGIKSQIVELIITLQRLAATSHLL